MKCNQANRRLLKLTANELLHLQEKELSEHISVCPECTATRDSLLQLIGDLRQGAEFNPSNDYWTGWSPLQKRSSRKVRSVTLIGHWLRWVDWALIPEKTFKWAGAFVLVMSITVGGMMMKNDRVESRKGLPNRLVVMHGPVLIHESLNRGLSLSPNTFSIRGQVNIPAEKDKSTGDRS